MCQSAQSAGVEVAGEGNGDGGVLASGLLPDGWELARLRLRQQWELASVLNFFNVFEPVIQSGLKISAEEMEKALISPNDSLAQIHIALLKGIPPVSKTLKSSNGWVAAMAKKLASWWPWVAEGKFPLVGANGEEVTLYKELDPVIRLLILKALCEVRAEQYDTVSYINDTLKSGSEVSMYRKSMLGGDGKRIAFWYDGNETIGYRLYQEVSEFVFDYAKGKDNFVKHSCQWETLATSCQEFHGVMDKLFSSNVSWQISIANTIQADILPKVKKLQKKRERASKQLQKKEVFMGPRTSGITRSCRNRAPVNYRYDDYDKAIEEAIRETKRRMTKEQGKFQGKESKHGESSGLVSNMNSADTTGNSESPAAESCIDWQGSHEADDTSSDESNQKNIADVDDNDDNPDRENENLHNVNRHVLNQRSCLQKGARGYHHGDSLVAQSANPQRTSLGAKNRLRQRPTLNTAAESLIVPDSEDEI